MTLISQATWASVPTYIGRLIHLEEDQDELGYLVQWQR